MDRKQSKRFWALTLVATVLCVGLFIVASVLRYKGAAAEEPKWNIDLRIIAAGGYLLFLVTAALTLTLRERLVKWFCTVAFWEAISFLLLMLFAMPLKYAAGMPLAVKYTGWVHGLLFIVYVMLLVGCWIQEGWKPGRVIGFFVASLLPFVPFWVEVRLKRELAQRRAYPDSPLR